MIFEIFEKKIMEKLLEGNDANLEILRKQYSLFQVAKREFTGTGFYVTFQNSENVPKVNGKQKFHIGDVRFELDGVPSGAGCCLFINNGYLDYLEGYTFDDPWPKEITLLNIGFDSGESRDMEKVKGLFS